MSYRIASENCNRAGNANVTTRKIGRGLENKMATSERAPVNADLDGSLLIDSILSHDETKDILSMLASADELPDGIGLPSFYTSTQMGGILPRRPLSPLLSPLMAVDRWDVDCMAGKPNTRNDTLNSENTTTDQNNKVRSHNRRNLLADYGSIGGIIDEGEGVGKLPKLSEGGGMMIDPMNSDLVNDNSVTDLGGPDDAARSTNSLATGFDDGEPANGDVNNVGEGTDVVEGSKDGDNVADSDRTVTEPCSDEEGEGQEEDIIELPRSHIESIEELLGKLDRRSVKTDAKMHELITSLEYSQHEIDKLNQEKGDIKLLMGQLDMEDKRTQYQLSSVEDKIDRMETTIKKKNLILEGLPEQDGRKEDVQRTVCALLDQLNVNKEITFEACFRVGPYIKGRTRPVHVSFEKQADRDIIYSRRFELRHTNNYQRVWMNEDLGAASKRKRGIIRMISKQAQEQGIDCKTGKYSLLVRNVKYDADNLEELPPQLQPTTLKQIQLDPKTIAYQSEYAPFSNFYPCKVAIGKHRFSCSEQAFQFLRAKSLNRHLLATKIYLTRDPRDMKQKGAEAGTSDEWETKQLDLMYICIKRKFKQNPELRELLLKTKDLELVEATPDRFWGCGATLSSNALRRHDWPGANKHGKILMIVREELRLKAEGQK